MTRWISPLLAVFVLLAIGLPTVRAQASFPYQAEVTGAGVISRSGPGEEYYATESLGTGQSVEVYKQVRGWAAIRPPRDSFSWVAAEFLKPVDATTGVIVGERVVSRVGSQFEEQRDVIQVFLDRGEEVDLLDPEPFPDADGERDWYMIAPPAGEFRWVRLSDLDSGRRDLDRDQPPASFASSASREPRLLSTLEYENEKHGDDHSGVTAAQYTEQSPAYDVQRGGAPLVRPPRPEYNSATTPTYTASRQPGSRWRDYRESLVDDTAQPTAPASPVNTGPIGAAGVPYAAAAGTGYVSYTDQLNEIELEIATMVAKDPTFWSFAPARAQLADVMARADTAVERGRAQSLTRKIDRLDDLKARYIAVVRHRGRSLTDSLVDSERASTFDDLNSSPRSPAVGDRADEVTGLLRPVVSKRPDAPAYALMDDNGQVRTFVSEAPGVELRNYVGKRVGLSGRVDYVPELRADIVTARRVTGVGDAPLRR